MEDIDAVLREIGRVVRREGGIYVAVPDASTITDRIYRWVYHGGGQVNAFRSAGELTSRIGEATGLPLAAVKTLRSPLWFLERRNLLPP